MGIMTPAPKRTLSPSYGVPSGPLRIRSAALYPVLQSHTDRPLSDRALSGRALSGKALSDRALSDKYLSDRSLPGRHLLSGVPGPLVVVVLAMRLAARVVVLSAACSE